MVIAEVPELVGLLPFAWTEKVSLPLYPACDVYTKEDTLSCWSVPCAGCCETLELNISPEMLTLNTQLPPEAISIYPIELKPQPAGADPDTTH